MTNVKEGLQGYLKVSCSINVTTSTSKADQLGAEVGNDIELQAQLTLLVKLEQARAHLVALAASNRWNSTGSCPGLEPYLRLVARTASVSKPLIVVERPTYTSMASVGQESGYLRKHCLSSLTADRDGQNSRPPTKSVTLRLK